MGSKRQAVRIEPKLYATLGKMAVDPMTITHLVDRACRRDPAISAELGVHVFETHAQMTARVKDNE